MANAIDLPSAPTMQEPPSRFGVKDGAAPGFIIGATDKPHDIKIVARTVGLRATFRLRDREFSAPANLHEVALQRRFYEAQGGSVATEAGWVPGLARHRNLTHAALMAEVQRLAETYRIPREGGVEDVFAQFFGTERNEQVRRIHALMRQQMADWEALLKTAAGRLPPGIVEGHQLVASARPGPVRDAIADELRRSMAADLITPAELDRIVNLADPSASAEELELPALTLEPAAPAPSSAEAAPPVDMRMTGDDAPATGIEAVTDRLIGAGVAQTKAMELATLLDLAGEGAKLSDEQITGIVGPSKAKLASVRSVIG